MKNELFSIGRFTIHGYGLMIGIGFVAAYLMTEYRAKKRGLDSDKIISLALWTIITGLISAKLLYYITVFDEILVNPRVLLNLADGFVIYGGIIGGIFGGYLFCRVNKVRFLQYFDLAIPSVALAQGFGRLGCLLAGCCYGLHADTPLSIIFTNSDFAPNGIPLIATQPISSVLNFLHCGLLLLAARKFKTEGRVAALYLICYSAGRFVLEFFRGDLARGAVGTISTSQFISLFIFAAGVLLFAFAPKLQKKKTGENTAAAGQ